jgi:hypothetical protein
MKSKHIYLFLATFLLSSITFAHGTLQVLPKEKLIEFQKKLVNEKYLNPKDFKYGVVNLATEDAYDKYQDDQFRKKKLEELSRASTTSIQVPVSVEEEISEEGVLTKIKSFFFKIFFFFL